eukprot:6464807-Prorocentrum_lima.AAC.1
MLAGSGAKGSARTSGEKHARQMTESTSSTYALVCQVHFCQMEKNIDAGKAKELMVQLVDEITGEEMELSLIHI